MSWARLGHAQVIKDAGRASVAGVCPRCARTRAALEGLVADAAQLMSKADTTDDIQRHAACHPSLESPGLLPVLGQKVMNAMLLTSSPACLGFHGAIIQLRLGVGASLAHAGPCPGRLSCMHVCRFGGILDYACDGPAGNIFIF